MALGPWSDLVNRSHMLRMAGYKAMQPGSCQTLELSYKFWNAYFYNYFTWGNKLFLSHFSIIWSIANFVVLPWNDFFFSFFFPFFWLKNNVFSCNYWTRLQMLLIHSITLSLLQYCLLWPSWEKMDSSRSIIMRYNEIS